MLQTTYRKSVIIRCLKVMLNHRGSLLSNPWLWDDSSSNMKSLWQLAPSIKSRRRSPLQYVSFQLGAHLGSEGMSYGMYMSMVAKTSNSGEQISNREPLFWYSCFWPDSLAFRVVLLDNQEHQEEAAVHWLSYVPPCRERLGYATGMHKQSFCAGVLVNWLQ